MRRAYVCEKCGKDDGVPLRKFVGEKDPVPSCRTHGKMVRQDNNRYFKTPPVVAVKGA